MRIVICTMEDPVYTLPLIREIIKERRMDIVGVAVSSGDRMSIRKDRSKLAYLLSLMLILGLREFLRISFTTISFKVRLILARCGVLSQSPSILAYAKSYGIETFQVPSVNDPDFLQELKRLDPEVIINQTQNLLDQNFLRIPKYGVINRHNALLPRNRGRLAPFWVCSKNESQTGVSIHFVNEKIDAGDIIVQRQFDVTEKEDVNSIVKKSYELAPSALLEALSLIEHGEFEPIPNNDVDATYNTTPTLTDALNYRFSRLRKSFG